MKDIWELIWCALIGVFRSRVELEAEVLVLPHQLNVLRRKCPKRVVFGNIDRVVFAGLYRLAPASSMRSRAELPPSIDAPSPPRRGSSTRFRCRPRTGSSTPSPPLRPR